MKLYVFSLFSYDIVPSLEKEVYEVEEKPKSYIGQNRSFNKTDIGTPVGYSMDECVLLEDNPGKAAEILLPVVENRLVQLEDKIRREQNAKEMLERYMSRVYEPEEREQ